jgi:hypothetical protein
MDDAPTPAAVEGTEFLPAVIWGPLDDVLFLLVFREGKRWLELDCVSLLINKFSTRDFNRPEGMRVPVPLLEVTLPMLRSANFAFAPVFLLVSLPKHFED